MKEVKRFARRLVKYRAVCGTISKEKAREFGNARILA